MVKITQVRKEVFVLTDRFGCGADLVVGSEGALLYDTGCGVDNMAEAVRSITDLPLTVIASHGHFDHIGGSRFFDRVYLSDRDRCITGEYNDELLNQWLLDLKKIKASTEPDSEKSAPGEPEDFGFTCNDWKQLVPLEAKEIPLGDITGQIIELPGHSLGSVGVLFPELRLLLGSDALEPIMCLMFKNHGDRYLQYETLKKVSGLEFDEYLTSHSEKLFSRDYILKMMECIETCGKKRFVEYEYPRPPYSEGYMYVFSLEDEPVGMIISKEENQRRLEE